MSNALRDAALGAGLVATGLAIATILAGAAIGACVAGFASLVAESIGVAL